MEIIWLTALIGIPGLIALWAAIYRTYLNARVNLKDTQRKLFKTEELIVQARTEELSTEEIKEKRDLL